MLITLALVKLLVASMMLWLPFRTDSAVVAVDDEARLPESGEDEDGGSKIVWPHGPAGPHSRRPWPTRPRRGPHGSCPPGSPPRVRIGRTERLRVQARRVRAN